MSKVFPSINRITKQRKQEDRQHERVVRMTQVIQSFASGFTLRPIKVKLVKSGKAPAFSSSDRIWFDESQIADLTTKAGVASLKGLTLHELSHILLTPRSGTEFRQWLIEEGLFHSWNGLEDQRIESQLIALYPSIKDWFNAMIAEYLLKHPEQWRVSFPLIHGRKYLDSKVRKVVKRAFKHQERVAELTRIIDTYRTLNFSDDADVETAKVLVAEYHELTKDLRLENPNGHNDRSETEHETNVKSRPLPKSKQTEASEKVANEEPEDDDDDLYDDINWDDSDDEPETDEPETDEPETDEPEEGDNGARIDEEEWDGADGSDWDGSDEDSDDEFDSDSTDSDDAESDDSSSDESDSDNTESGDGDQSETEQDSESSSDGEASNSPAQEEMERILNESLAEVFERLDDKLTNDIRLYNGDALMEGEIVPDPPRYKNQQTMPVSAEAVQGSEAFEYELKRLRAEHDPAWNKRVSSGRINPARWEQGCDPEEAFDRFEMGRSDVTDIEAVVLLDVSSSMSSFEREAHESMWAIKNALDSVGSNTSVVAYSDYWDEYQNSCFTLYSRDEKVNQEMRFIPNLGGTDPLKALQYAQGLLANSTRAIKLLFIVTDGEWAGECLDETERIINNLRDGGVITSLAWLSSYDIDLNRKNTHGAEIVSHVTKASDLFHLGRSIVEVGIDRQLTH